MRSKGSREFGFKQSHGGRASFSGGEWGKSSEFRESDSFKRSPEGGNAHQNRDYGLWDMDFSGRGPKGYKRSDERIREEVSEALYLHPLVDASDVEVKVHEGHVTLSGMVDNREMKREAERAIENISGVVDVFNELRLEDNSERRSAH